ncbi:MAG TPA: hypothetical protein VNV86_19620 [Candidatus Acidoferrum sp.]|nr:hypothetical protein [Candidatus Acidoferrum sp.]
MRIVILLGMLFCIIGLWGPDLGKDNTQEAKIARARIQIANFAGPPVILEAQVWTDPGRNLRP